MNTNKKRRRGLDPNPLDRLHKLQRERTVLNKVHRDFPEHVRNDILSTIEEVPDENIMAFVEGRGDRTFVNRYKTQLKKIRQDIFCNLREIRKEKENVLRESEHGHHLIETLQCPTCYHLPEVPTVTPCNHVFCNDCILTWIQRKNETAAPCPMCRAWVYQGDLRPCKQHDSLLDVFVEQEQARRDQQENEESEDNIEDDDVEQEIRDILGVTQDEDP